MEAGKIRTASTKALVDSLAQVRQQQLDALDSIFFDLKELETMHIEAKCINHYQLCPYQDIMCEQNQRGSQGYV